MYEIKMMMDRETGYKTVGYTEDFEKAKELKLANYVYYSPIDIYITRRKWG